MKSRSPADLSRVFRKCAQFFDSVSESDLARFLNGTMELALVGSDGQRFTEDDERLRRGQEDLDQLAERLRAVASREEALKILRGDELLAGRSDLARLAKLLRIHVTKSDKREVLEDKIAENVIGVRLRSEAIQGVNLKSTSGRGPEDDWARPEREKERAAEKGLTPPPDQDER